MNIYTKDELYGPIQTEGVQDFLNQVLSFSDDTKNLILFRGQGNNFPLLPSVARGREDKETNRAEANMLVQLKRRSKLVITKQLEDKWDWLVYAQHYGMRTRLLDWTSNPLVALWFAVNDALKFNNNGFVFLLETSKGMLLDKLKHEDPFQIISTKVFKPSLNNERIVAQSGWFTAHTFSRTSNRWIPLQNNSKMKENLYCYEFPKANLKKIIKELNTLGINHQSLFPDIFGVCQYINWMADNNKLNH